MSKLSYHPCCWPHGQPFFTSHVASGCCTQELQAGWEVGRTNRQDPETQQIGRKNQRNRPNSAADLGGGCRIRHARHRAAPLTLAETGAVK